MQWIIGGLRKLPLVGLPAVRGRMTWTFAAYSRFMRGFPAAATR